MMLFSRELYASDECQMKVAITPINDSISQDTIVVNYKNINLSDLLWKLEKKYKFNIVFNPTLIKKYQDICINIKGSLDDVLTYIFKDKNLSFTIENGIYIINKKKDSKLLKYFASKKIKIWGRITDAKNNPLSGVSVIIKGTKVGVVTNSYGCYNLSLGTKDFSLIFSYVGMKSQEVTFSGEGEINIVLHPETQKVDEVVVVAYGISEKESLTGAISYLNNKTIENRSVTNVASLLEGRVTGVRVNDTYGEPGADPIIRIRGFTSINGSNSPLYILNGVPLLGYVSDINSFDIQSISILKDASSAALYGNRAANGVVLINTKKGLENQSHTKIDINCGLYSRGIKDYSRLNANEWMEVMWKGYRNQLKIDNSRFPNIESANKYASENLVSTFLKYNIYNKPANQLFDSKGKLNAEIIDKYKGDFNWAKEVERVGMRRDINLGFDGGNSNYSYFFSVGYLDEEGYLVSSSFDRLSATANLSIRPKRWINIGLNFAATYQHRNKSSGTFGENSLFSNPFMFVRNIAPIYPVHLHDMETGDYVLDANDGLKYDTGVEFSRPQYAGRHIIMENELNINRYIRTTKNVQTYLKLNPIKSITLSFNASLNLVNSDHEVYDNSIIGDGAGLGRLNKSNNYYKDYLFSELFLWDKHYNLSNFQLLLGHENFSEQLDISDISKSSEKLDLGYKSELSNFSINNTSYGYLDSYKTESYFGRLKYNYNKKYFTEFSLRRDGSSRFARNFRWGNFYSIGAGWLLHKEEFIQSLRNWINVLKFRISYGSVGNDASANLYSYLTLYNLDQNANKGATYMEQYEANNLKWETTNSYDMAIKGRFFNKLSLIINLYYKRSKDLLFDVYYPLSSGSTSDTEAEFTIEQNIGEVLNNGLEFSLSYKFIKSEDLNWELGINGSLPHNEIVSLPDVNGQEGIIYGSKKYMEGHSIYEYWLYQYAGVDQMTGECLYLANKNESLDNQFIKEINGIKYSTNPTYAQKDWSGSAIPKIYGSFNSELKWKCLSLNVLATFSLGGKTLDNPYMELMSVNGDPHAIHSDILKAWTNIPNDVGENSNNRIDKNGVPETNFTKDIYNNVVSTRFLISSDYLVIKNIMLKYELSDSLCDKLNINNASLALSINNLFTFTKRQGMNPQQSFNGTNTNVFVSAKVFNLGLKIISVR